MPINVYWDTPTRDCLVIEISSPNTWDQFHVRVQDTYRLIAESSHTTVDVIVCTSGEPPDGTLLPRLRRIFDLKPPNTGQIIVVMDASPTTLMFVRRLASTIQRMFPRKVHIVFVESFEEARRLSAASRGAVV